ncbi:MAG: ATP-binding cassette domain-containing protein [Enterococcus casseliflavus]|nr:ATP-binding cassette domain-containing protein [Enterococcus casseliflavus]MDN6949231.1 ATP-binding cassette domain-containing protein [Enterococcus faecium]
MIKRICLFLSAYFYNNLKSTKGVIYSMNPTKNPQAYILGGQSGAGKSTLHKLILEEMQGNIIIVDNDTFKPLHPNYDQLAVKIGVEVT